MDFLTNVSGPFDGDLDPAKGMTSHGKVATSMRNWQGGAMSATES